MLTFSPWQCAGIFRGNMLTFSPWQYAGIFRGNMLTFSPWQFLRGNMMAFSPWQIAGIFRGNMQIARIFRGTRPSVCRLTDSRYGVRASQCHSVLPAGLRQENSQYPKPDSASLALERLFRPEYYSKCSLFRLRVRA